MSSKQTVLVVDFPTVLSCLCLVDGLLLVLGTAGRTRGALTGFASKVISVAAAMASTLTMPLAILACTESTDG